MTAQFRKRGAMAVLEAIPKEERYGLCAGFGQVFHLQSVTQVRYRTCRRCGGTGRKKESSSG